MGMIKNMKNVKNIKTFDEMDEKINNNENTMDLVFVLDKSGSMFNVVDDTIGGFNSLIEKQKIENPDSLVTLVLFDTEYKVIYNRTPIKEVKKLDYNIYYPTGWTALYDAIGTTINLLDEKSIDKVLFAITTDGLENSSRKFGRGHIRNMIMNHDWEFIFLGADIDAFEEAGSLGISRSHTAQFSKTGIGVAGHWRSLNFASRSISNGISLDDEKWKEELEK